MFSKPLQKSSFRVIGAPENVKVTGAGAVVKATQPVSTSCTENSAGLERAVAGTRSQIVPSDCTCRVSPFHRRAAPAW